MGIKDEIREQNKKWKTMNPEEKWNYFMTYYKWVPVIICIVVIFVFTLVRTIILNSRELVLYVMVLNNSDYYVNMGLADEFAEYAGIDTSQYRLLWDTNNIFVKDQYDYTTIAVIQKFESYADDGMLDAIILPESDMAYFEEEEYFIVDLKDFLDTEVYEAVSDRLYTYHCSSMDEDICIGFYLDPEDRFYETGLFDDPKETEERAVLIPLYNSTHLDYLYRFMRFMREL